LNNYRKVSESDNTQVIEEEKVEKEEDSKD